MKYYQCLDKDCKEIFSEDNAYRLFWDNKLVALKCPYCRGFIEEISEAIGIADKERKEQGFEKYKQEYNVTIKQILADIEKRKLDGVRSALKI